MLGENTKFERFLQKIWGQEQIAWKARTLSYVLRRTWSNVRNVVNLPQDDEVGVAEEVSQLLLEYRIDDGTSYDFQEKQFEENKENQKRKTIDLKESLKSEGFVGKLEEAVKSKKWRKKDAKDTFYDELLEVQQQQLKLLEDSEKQFQVFQSKMLEKELQVEAVEKQKDGDFFRNLVKCLDK